MNRTAHRRGWLALVMAGAFVAALPTAAAADETPIDAGLPMPTVPSGTVCGSDDNPVWKGTPTLPQGMSVTIGIPRPTMNGVSYQGVVHAWDADGSQAADGSVAALPILSQSVYVPLPLADGHTYGWHASTYDGTAYSNPTEPCYFRVDAGMPLTPVVTNPDFPPVGSPGTPTKADGQPTTFFFSAPADPLPTGCAEAGTPDCRASGLDHFEYAFGSEPGIGAHSVPVDAEGNGSLTVALGWGAYSLGVIAVDKAGNRSPAGGYEFSVPWQLPPASPTTLGLTGPAKSGRGTRLLITGQLSASPYPAGEIVHVTKSDQAHPSGTALPDVPLSADGTFGIADVPQVGGINTYTVTYPGDATHQASTASTSVQVSRAATALTVTANASLYAYGATAKITSHLGTTYNGRIVALYAQPYGGKRTLIKTGTVDSHGNLAAGYKIIRKTTFTASFAGDYRYAPAKATRTASVHAKVSDSLSGSYGNTHSGSITYRLYHHTAKAQLNVTVTPGKAGQCVRFQTQRYYGGAWHTQSTTTCHTLSTKSGASATLGLTKAVNSRFRMRAEYVHSSKDTGNLDTWGAWQYFTVTR
ncbi:MULTISPECIES: hypothetical protein [unclassified Streptomyces]|uniref:hypothetical protein n=1 Tax=unclassified Streptomyces TaxID=2593676 RepID=UPI00381C1E6F